MAFLPPPAFRRLSLPFEDKYPEYLLHQSSVLCHNDSDLHFVLLSEKEEHHILLQVFWLHGWAPAEKCSGLLLLFRNAELAGETALLLVLLINSLGVDLMSKSGLGISMISSVPLIFNNVFPIISFGTWNYIFQTLLVITLMILKRSFCPGYLFSFVVGIGFGKWSTFTTSGFRHCQTHCHWMCFTLSRDLSEILKKKYKLIKTSFDLSCLTTTVILSLVILHRFYGIGIGTVFCAFLTGKTVSIIQKFAGEHIEFYRLTGKKRMMLGRNVRHA